MSFKHWPLLSKILSILFLLAVFSGGAVFLAGSHIRSVQQAYSDALTGPAAANTTLARALRLVVQYNRVVYQLLTSVSPEQVDAALKDEKKTLSGFPTRMGDAAAQDPAAAEQIAQFQKQFQDFLGPLCGSQIDDAHNAKTIDERQAVARDWNVSCAPELNKLASGISDFIDDRIAKLDVMQQQLAASTDRTILIVYGVTFGGLLLVLVIAVLVTRTGIVRPITRLRHGLTELAHGAYDMTVHGVERKDEIGGMARDLETLRQALSEGARLREEMRIQEERAAENLKAERNVIADEFEQRMGALAHAFANSSSEVSDAAKSLSANAEETSRQAQAVSGASEEASANVQTVAASTEEMTASIREVGVQVTNAASIAIVAAEEAGRTEAEIRELSQAASQIGEVIELITNIASQTNLLALNATIEAARAGEMGKGFAVVAQEVKQLASQTANATEQIGRKIGEIQQATNRTVGSIEKIVGTISQIRSATTAIASAIEEQGAATREIAGNTQRAAQGTEAVNDNISGVGRAAEMTGAASTQLMTLSEALSSQANSLQQEVSVFVQNLRAG